MDFRPKAIKSWTSIEGAISKALMLRGEGWTRVGKRRHWRRVGDNLKWSLGLRGDAGALFLNPAADVLVRAVDGEVWDKSSATGSVVLDFRRFPGWVAVGEALLLDFSGELKPGADLVIADFFGRELADFIGEFNDERTLAVGIASGEPAFIPSLRARRHFEWLLGSAVSSGTDV